MNGSRFSSTLPLDRSWPSFPDFVAALQQFPLGLKTQLPTLQEQFPDPIQLIRRGLLTPLRILRDRQNELFLGRYNLIERLGEGGTGQVFKAS